MSGVYNLTEPAFEPVSLDEAKLWLRIDDDIVVQDAVVLLLIKAMRRRAEELTGRAFASRTCELRLDAFPPEGRVYLPNAPLRSVQYVRYLDTNGDLQNLTGSPTEYQENLVSVPGFIAPLYGEAWPATRADYDAVRIGFTAGYSTFAAVPPELKLWMQAKIATHNEFREAVVSGTIVATIPRDYVDSLLDGLVLGTRLFG